MSEKEGKKWKKSRDVVIRMAPHFLNRVISQFDEIEKFKHFTLSAIEREKEKINKSFDEMTTGMAQEEIDRYADLYSDDYFMVSDVFSKISLNSYIIILYSYIESGLNTLCDAKFSDQAMLSEKRGKEPVKVRYIDMQGDGIRRAKLYMEKVFNVHLHTGEQPWAEIDALRRIRNAIVHDEGWANEALARNQCVKACADKGFLEIGERKDGNLGHIIIKSKYLDWITEQAREFFRKIKV